MNLKRFLLFYGLVLFISACGGDKSESTVEPTPTPNPTPVPSNKNITFSDANFKAYLVTNFDMNKDGEISYDEAKKVRGIFASGLQIKNLYGIEYFTELQELDISNNQITNIDFTTSQSKLTTLIANNNLITGKVNLSPLTGLTSVKIVSGNDNITAIHVANQIMANNFNLQDKTNKYTASGVVDEYIKFVDENFKQAAVANADKNRDGEVTISEAANFTGIFEATSRQIKTLEDIKYFKNISSLKAANNVLTKVSLTGFYNLTDIELGGNLISTYEFFDLPKLKRLSLSGNSLTEFKLEGFGSLESLILSDNNFLSSIDISRLVSLKELKLKNTNLSGVIDLRNLILDPTLVEIKDVNPTTGIGSSPNITQIIVNTDSLASILNRKENTNVYTGPNSGVSELITVSDSRLNTLINRALGTSGKTQFTKTQLQSIKKLDVDNNVKDVSVLAYCTGLTELNFYASVSSFNFANLINLTKLTISGNSLINVAFGSLVALKTIDFRAPNVKTLDISGCTAVTTFTLGGSLSVECIKTPTLQLANLFNEQNAGLYPSKDKFNTTCN